VSRLPALSIDAYHTADARVAWRPAPDLELFVSGENLLQPYHTEFAHSPAPFVGIARSVYAGFTWTSRDGAP
jgi:iron complex outermembrane receptor protein